VLKTVGTRARLYCSGIYAYADSSALFVTGCFIHNPNLLFAMFIASVLIAVLLLML
jgi:hypothetical protein